MDIHPYEEFISDQVTKLIIGTIPPHRFCVKDGKLKPKDVRFYYGSARNDFWRLVGGVVGQEFLREPTPEAVEQRKNFLRERRIGITDIIYSCKRKNNGASDKDLDVISRKNIRQLLSKHSSITELIYTSGFVKSLICKELTIYHTDFSSNCRRMKLVLDGRGYDVQILYSPSPQALRGLGKDGESIRRAQYRQVFGT